MKTLLLLIIGASLILIQGCSTMFTIDFDGENWNFGIGGKVPKIPLIDYDDCQ